MNLKLVFLALVFLTLGLVEVAAQTNTQTNSKEEKEYKIKLTTIFGDMVIKLHNDTPLHRDNFLNYVRKGWYEGTLFHRVIPFFMAQGGDPNSVGASETQVLGSDRCATVPNEIRRHYFHKKGALASARLPNGSNPTRQSSACQFFIVQGYKHTDKQLDAMETANFKFSDIARAYYTTVGGAASLDMEYTIFGEVIEGLDIIDLICAMTTGKHVTSRPNTDIVMNMEIIED